MLTESSILSWCGEYRIPSELLIYTSYDKFLEQYLYCPWRSSEKKSEVGNSLLFVQVLSSSSRILYFNCRFCTLILMSGYINVI